MKKLFLFIFATMLAGQVWAYDYQEGNLYYRQKDVQSVVVTWQLAGSSNYSTLTWANIASTIVRGTVSYAVVGIDSEAFHDCYNLTTVSIPNSVTSIGSKAFYYCSKLKTIAIPSSITSIGSGAFSNSGLTKAVFESIESLCGIEFDDANANPLSIAKHLYIGSPNDDEITELEIPSSITSVGKYAFSGSNFTSITINSDADFRNTGLCFTKDGILYRVLDKNTVEVVAVSYSGDVVIPATVSSGNSFTVSSIDGSALDNCNLSSLTINTDCDADFSAGNAKFSTDGIEYKIMGKNSVMVIAIPQSGDVVIPNTVSFGDTYTVTSINGSAFNNCNLTSLTINADCDVDFRNIIFTKDNIRYKIMDNNSVEIVDNSYSGEVTIPTIVDFCNKTYTIASISNNAFAGCTNIDYTLYRGCKYIGNEENPYFVLLGANSTSITSVEIDSNCKFICSGAFNGCNSLTSITIPESVVNIGADAFKDCSNMTKAEYASIADLCKIKFGNNDANPLNNAQHLYISDEEITELVIPENVTNIDYAFCGCNSFVSVTTNSDVDYNKSGLSFTKNDIRYRVLSKNEVEVSAHTYAGDIVIPESVTAGSTYSVITIGDAAFSNCGDLTSVVIPNTVTKIGCDAFSVCCKLKSITIPESVTYIGANAFNLYSPYAHAQLCKAEFSSIAHLCKIEFGNEYANPLAYAVHLYVGGKEIKELNIPESVTYIGNYTFYNCKELVYVAIPNSVTKIGDYAFYGCIGLNFVNIPDGVTRIGSHSFFGGKKSNLELVSIPASVITIGERAFYNEKITFYCEPTQRPADWVMPLTNYGLQYNYDWNSNVGTVIWGVKAKITQEYIYKVTSITEPYTIEIYKYLSNDNSKVIIYESETFYGIEYQVAGIATLDKKAGKIVCMSETPIVLSTDPFPQNDTIYVPSTSVNKYKTSAVWKRKEIVPFYVVAAKSADEAKGIVQGDSLMLGSLTITAAPAEGYHFVSWSDGNTDAVRNLTKAPNETLIATFEAHTEVTDAAVAATCTTTGLTEGSHCSVCGEVFVAQQVTTMLEHTIVVDAAVPATCTETGLTEGSHCTVCNTVLVEQETVAAKGHTEVVDAGFAPTCTEFGITNGKHCSVCNIVLVARDTIQALGHTVVVDSAVAATATEIGLTEGSHCSVCGLVIVAQDTIPALGEPGEQTAVVDDAASAVNIYATGHTIVVENATDEIRVYNAMGALVCRDVACRVRATITVKNTGVYIVKTGNVVKRVMVN